MKLIQYIVAVTMIILAQSAMAQGQGNGPPTNDVNVVNTPDVNVVNTPEVNVANMPDVNVANAPT